MQFIVSNLTNPYYNLAVENYLMQRPDDDSVVLYLWRNRRTVVIGRNQNPFTECNLDLLRGEGGFLLRRTTGGGAVYHDDGNINFSFVAPTNLYSQEKQFEVIHRALLDYGIESELSGRNDILAGGRKFSGNAFSKSATRRLHHGTLLIDGNMDDLSRYLRVDSGKLHKHGVTSVRSRVVNLSELADVTCENIVPHMRSAFADVYGDDIHTVDYDELIALPQVRQLSSLYSSEEWLYGNWERFKAGVKKRFEWGLVELSLSVDEKSSLVTGVEVATDCLDVDFVDVLHKTLVGASSRIRPQVEPSSPCSKMVDEVLDVIY